MKNITNEISSSFKFQMWLNNGDYNNIRIQSINLSNFSFNESPTLKTIIGGTQQLDVWLTDIKVNSDGSYKASLQFNIIDNFGISESDIYNPSLAARHGQNAMAALWILQKQRGYKGFRNVCSFKINVNGKF